MNYKGNTRFMDIFMSQKEVDRSFIFEKVKDGQIKLTKASELLNLSYPQVKRLWARYKKKGPKGLISRKRGKQSNRKVSETKRKEIVRIISTKYQNCKPLFISEKLKEHEGIKFSSEFIRQLMIEYHLWIPKQTKQQIQQRRQRRECEGELIQIDASDHDWFEGRAPKCHLHLLVDDATSKIMGGHFASGETTEGYYRACLPYFQECGRPVSLYNDKRGTFVVNNGIKRKPTQFARAMQELGVKMITAHSPQAKGRIERAFGTLQERLVWEMRLKNISTIEEANDYLPNFFKEYNNRFTEKPTNPLNAHRPLNQKISLKYILCTKEVRTISKNLEVQYDNVIYQLKPTKEFCTKLRRSKVNVITTLDGEIVFEFHGQHIDYIRYDELEYHPPEISIDKLMENWKDGRNKGSKPSKHHPWRGSKVA